MFVICYCSIHLRLNCFWANVLSSRAIVVLIECPLLKAITFPLIG